MSKNHQIIDDVSFAILKNKLVGERPTVTKTDNFTIKLSNTLQGDIHGSLNRVNNNSGWFRLPQDEKLFSFEDYTQVYTQVEHETFSSPWWNVQKMSVLNIPLN